MLSNQKPGNEVINLPQNLEFTAGIDHMNQVVSYERMVYFGYIFEESGLLSQKMQSSPSSKRSKPAVVFGARAVPESEIK